MARRPNRMSQALLGRNSRQGLWAFPLLIVLMGAAWLTATSDDFTSAENLSNLIAQAMPLIIVAIGQMFVVLLGGLDLSVGAVISLTTAILAMDGHPLVLLVMVFLAAIAVGLTNGVAVSYLSVNPIIATLATQMIVMGITRFIRPVAGGHIPDFVAQSVNGTLLGLPAAAWWGIVVILLAWKLAYGSRFGLHVFAIGGGASSGREDAAHTFGISDKRTVVLAFVLCSCFAALAGIFLAGRIVSGDPNVGPPFALDSITAVALGGTQLAGGIGSLHGTIIGAVLLALLSNGMNLANLSVFVQTAIKGFILLVVVALQSRKKMGL